MEDTSAGGMVVREIDGRHQVAIIARYNRGGRLEWVLPKGHPENDENHRQAAEREVAEETGISGEVLTALGSIDYWFTVPGRRVHKTVHHFLLRATGGELTIENDPDQEAVDVAWVDLDRLSARLTFLNERRIVEAAQMKMDRYFDVPRRQPPRQRRIIPRPRQLPSGFIASVSGEQARRREQLEEQHQPAAESGSKPTPVPDATAAPTPLTVFRSINRRIIVTSTPAPTGIPTPADLVQRAAAQRAAAYDQDGAQDNQTGSAATNGQDRSGPQPGTDSPASSSTGTPNAAAPASAGEPSQHHAEKMCENDAPPTPFELRMRIRRFRAAVDFDAEAEQNQQEQDRRDGPPKPGPHLGRHPH